MENKIAEIAQKVLSIKSLQSQGSDESDFHDIAVWEIKKALEEAYRAGKNKKEEEIMEICVNRIKDTEIKITNDGEFRSIHGVSYDLANPSNKEENGLLLTLLRMAAIEVIKEQNS